MLEPAGVEVAARAFSGHVGLLSGDRDVDGLERQPVRFDERPACTLSFGPARRRVRVTGVAVFQGGVRILTERLTEPETLAPGQSIEFTVSLEAMVD